MTWALIKNGLVENVIVADIEFIKGICDQWDFCQGLPENSPVGIGWTYIDGEFTDERANP
jgi:hypothetical protein